MENVLNYYWIEVFFKITTYFPQQIVSDKAAVFKKTADWILKICRSWQLQDFLAAQEIQWKYNLVMVGRYVLETPQRC